jgi:hypothetical protein
MTPPKSTTPPTNSKETPAKLAAFVQKLNDNVQWPYAGYEVTETRRKYHLLNHVLGNDQRGGLYLIDRNTLEVYQSKGYGQAGRYLGTLESMAAYLGLNGPVSDNDFAEALRKCTGAVSVSVTQS